MSHLGPLSVERDEVTTMAVAIVRVFVVPAQCQPRHGECLNNVYDQKEIVPPEGRLCIDCLFLDAISALPRLPSPIAWVFSCDMNFAPKFFGLPDTPVAHSF